MIEFFGILAPGFAVGPGSTLRTVRDDTDVVWLTGENVKNWENG
jgi:hypothetical protein